VYAAKARDSAWNSIGSPSGVALPWASTIPIPAGSIRNVSYTFRSSRSWDRALGAVMPLVAPSWLVPQPRITPWM
jgi:hypothetical protein